VPLGPGASPHSHDHAPDVDIVIVTYNSAATVGAAIESLAGSPLVKSIVVVDNGSGDGSATAARSAGATQVIENTGNPGFAVGVNQGLSHCAADHVLLLNPDARLDHSALDDLRSKLRTTPRAAVVAPLLRDHAGNVTTGSGRFATLTRRIGLCLPLIGRHPHFSPTYRLTPEQLAAGRCLDVDYAYGAALLVDRGFLDQTGGLDERYFLFCEDEDLCRQAHAAGRRVLLDLDAIGDHTGGASCGDPADTEARRLFATYLLFSKWRGARAATLYRTGITLALWLRQGAVWLERDREGRRSVQWERRRFAEAVRTHEAAA
jgi:N-acetylglucosaminyl-diphospho-decaprenol L-rhamnosyltransferase